ncbi:MAG: PAS domain S-box protein, partial [Desulfomonile tiedjei]|nr:PAS domain S-box protein [Desulfomonile tiedjei]
MKPSPSIYALIGLAILALPTLYVVSLYNYTLFHCLAEGFSIIVGCAIFLIAWNTRRFLDNNYIMLLGVASLFVASIDFLHALAYKGMGVFPNADSNLPTQLWIAARYLQSGSFLIAPLLLGRRMGIKGQFAAFSLITVGMLGAIYFNIFPDCFIEGVGLTPFKIISEYVICLALLASAVMLIRHRSSFDKTVTTMLLCSIAFFTASELSFTYYVSVYGFSNFIGHYSKIISCYFLYKAIIETGLRRPYDLLFRDLERKQLALAQERNFVTTILDTVSALVIVLDPLGKIVGFNKACEKLTGFTFEEVKGGEFWDLFLLPEEKDAVRDIFRRFVVWRLPIEHENFWQAKDNASHLVAWSYTSIVGQTGQIEYVIGTGVDVTERRRAEIEIIRAKEEWEKTFDAVPDLIMILDRNHRIVRANRAMSSKIGVEPVELAGRACYEVFHNMQEPVPFCVHSKLLEDGMEHSIEFFEENVNGLFSVSCSPLLDQDGQLLGSVHVSRDITERKRAEEALRENEQRFRSTFEQAAVGIAHVALDGRYLRVNHRICDILGCASDELPGLTFSDMIHPADARETILLLRQLLVGAVNTVCSENRMVRNDGSFVWVNLTVSLHRDKLNAPNYFIWVLEDISKRKQMEEALQATLTELERSNSELQQFAYVASHDLQEPLRMVSSYVSLLERRYKKKLDADADEFIAYAADGAKRMQRLINDLLQYSRVGARRKPFEPTDCESVLDQVMANLHIAIENSRARVIRSPLPTVLADQTQLVQLFQNLVDNALKFRGDEPPLIHVSASQDGDHWLFSIRDNGIGIDSQYKDRIFVIFQRLHGREQYSGTGIGLAVCKKIVERHGGKIWLESN